jgi:hypothetical protein
VLERDVLAVGADYEMGLHTTLALWRFGFGFLGWGCGGGDGAVMASCLGSMMEGRSTTAVEGGKAVDIGAARCLIERAAQSPSLQNT